MQIPAYWAEARLQQKNRERSVTVRRFGWSDESQRAAQEMADARCAEAFSQVLAGRNLHRREQRVPYNGAEGLPIREEILAKDGDAVITRNAYGAHCLNVPDVLFADVDFDDFKPTRGLFLACFFALAIVAFFLWYQLPSNPCDPKWGLPLVLLCVIGFIPLTQALYAASVRLRGGVERLATRRVDRFVQSRPDWRVRLYRTPAGLRSLATHRRFAPDDPEVTDYFDALNVDRLYASMCRRQQCFRARLTGKPWRMGIQTRMKPSPGVWPVSEDRLEERQSWAREYDLRSTQFSACRFIRELGSGRSSSEVSPTQTLHDDLSGALGTRPLA